MSKLYVAGIGPGDYENMTIKALKVLEKAQVIVGYTVYIDLVKEYFPKAKMLSTPMRRERERCILALKEAQKGQSVVMVCSGDAQVYGMASLIYEVSADYPEVEIEIISGVTAALSGGSLLGAPLNHDFAVISLSDLLTPWEKIEKRLALAAQADFCIALYNPSSRKRPDYLKKACEIILQYAQPNRICGVTKNIGRDGEETAILTLGELAEYNADMFSTVFIGNSQTKNIGGKMITPRGYEIR